MARPRKSAIAAGAAGIDPLLAAEERYRKPGPDGLPPTYRDDGTINPHYLKASCALILDAQNKALQTGERPAIDLEKHLKVVLNIAEIGGMSRDEVVSRRAPEDVIASAARTLMSGEADTLLELSDQVISGIEKGIERQNLELDYRLRDALASDTDAESLKTMLAERERGKAWLNRIGRVRRLRELVRNPVPEGTPEKDRDAWEAGRILRLMLYVGRTNVAGMDHGLFKFGPHHAALALTVWMAETGGVIVNNTDGPGKRILKDQSPYTGAVVKIPMGHGKTQFACFWAADRMARDPNQQGTYLHASGEKASQNVSYIANLLGTDTPEGRRFNTITPVRLAGYGNTKTSIRLAGGINLISPSLQAAGIMGKMQGADNTFQVWDDVVEPSDQFEDTTRARRRNMLDIQWERRIRGARGTFILMIGTPFHPEDALETKYQDAIAGRNRMLPCFAACGGPKSDPPFKPVWPEMYPTWKLRDMFHSVGPAVYAAAYMCDPRPDELRIIKKIRLYDVESEEHAEFLDRCVRHLSIDPAASGNKKSDKTGMLYAGVGDAKYGNTWKTELRVISAASVTNTPADLVETITTQVATHRTDYVHLETVSGMIYLSEALTARNIDTINHTTGNLGKTARLKAVAYLIEDSNAESGGNAASVLFPGRVGAGGELEPVPEFRWAHEQVLNFGISKDDHFTDALVQLVHHLANTGSLPPGGSPVGVATERVLAVGAAVDPRLATAFRKMRERANKSNDPVDQFWSDAKENDSDD